MGLLTYTHVSLDYSSRNPVPTIESYEKNIESLKAKGIEQQTNKSTSDEYQQGSKSKAQLDHADQQTKGLNSSENSEAEKQEIMDRMKIKNVKPTKELELRGQRTVMDPVTKSKVIISDSQFDINEGLSYFKHPSFKSLGHLFHGSLTFVFRLSSLPRSFTIPTAKF